MAASSPTRPAPPSPAAGFSLVEILVAMLGGAILALTVGLILMYAFRGLAEVNQSVDRQRDGAYVLEVLNHHLRSARQEAVTTTSTSISIQDDGNTMLFYLQGSDLIFDPDDNQSGDEETLLGGQVQSFTVTSLGTSLFIDLVVEEDLETTTFSIESGFRN